MTNAEEFEEEDFDQQEFEKIAKLAQEDTRKAMLKIIASNTDNRSKPVGEMVIVWDCSRLTDLETSKVNFDVKTHSIMGNYPSIVIEDGCKYIAKITTFAGDFSKVLDLVVWNKRLNKKFRTSSDFVKRYEPQYKS